MTQQLKGKIHSSRKVAWLQYLLVVVAHDNITLFPDKILTLPHKIKSFRVAVQVRSIICRWSIVDPIYTWPRKGCIINYRERVEWWIFTSFCQIADPYRRRLAFTTVRVEKEKMVIGRRTVKFASPSGSLNEKRVAMFWYLASRILHKRRFAFRFDKRQ